MIIYIHGFGGSGNGNKATLFRSLFHSEHFIAPSLPINPTLAFSTLSELIEAFIRTGTVMLIGSSLGGFYALHLASKYNLKAVLINPAVHPYETLSRSIGTTGGENFYDSSRYEWNESHLDALRSFGPINANKDNILLFLQKGDEVLDYTQASTMLDGCEQIIEDGGSHSFDGIERHIEKIKQFFAVYHSKLIADAVAFASKAHDTQTTPMGLPYMHHLMTVAMRVLRGTRDDGLGVEEQEKAVIVALLHDTIEDTAAEYDDIKASFGDTIADAVLALTKNKFIEDKESQMVDSLNRITAQPHWVWCVKLADRITNLTGAPTHWDKEKKAKYLMEAQTIWKTLHEASPSLSKQLLTKIKQYKSA